MGSCFARAQRFRRQETSAATKVTPLRRRRAESSSRIPAEEAAARIQILRYLHVEMDQAVLAAYGWSDLSLGHGFHEVEFLPENDQARYTVSPEARRELLTRLLKLNHTYHGAETKTPAAVIPETAARRTRKKSKARDGRMELF